MDWESIRVAYSLSQGKIDPRRSKRDKTPRHKRLNDFKGWWVKCMRCIFGYARRTKLFIYILDALTTKKPSF